MRQFFTTLFLVLGAICIVVLGLTFIQALSSFEYGNHLVLENHISSPVDSINVWVCKDQVTFTPWYDSTGVADLSSFAENIDPVGDYDGCAVIFTVYTPDKIIRLVADAPFECSGCDVNHYYRLTDSLARYMSWPYPYEEPE